MHVQSNHRTLDLSYPAIMGVVNASRESFSDSASERESAVQQKIEQALEKVSQGADIIDVGGQTINWEVPEVSTEQELERVLPLIEGLRKHSDVLISIDTYRPEVAQAALDAGADIVNDAYGLMDAGLAVVAARNDAPLVLAHNLRPPKDASYPTDYYENKEHLLASMTSFFYKKIAEIEAAGLHRSKIIIDPGPDLSKSPAQTVAMLQALPGILPDNLPVLLAISRKDFIGFIAKATPQNRGPGTLAAIAYCTAKLPHSIFRVHDVWAARQFLEVLKILKSDQTLPWADLLPPHLSTEW